MPKFFVGNKQIINEVITIVGEDVNHIVNVLRLQKSDQIFVCDKEKEITYQTEIVEIGKQEVVCHIIKEVKKKIESSADVTIFQGLPKSDKMEYIIQKATEIGAKEIVPVAMKRCIAKIDGKDEAKKIERWKKIAEMAAKQSGRDMIPKIGNVMKFNFMKKVVEEFDLFLVAYEEEERLTLKQVLQDSSNMFHPIEESRKMKIGVLIGPEGGIDGNEIEELKNCDVKIITLGNRILRTETASLVILSNIMYELDG